jgi:hypothetical protein
LVNYKSVKKRRPGVSIGGLNLKNNIVDQSI